MKKLSIAGWILSGAVSAFLAFGSATGKFTEWDGKQAMFDHLGYSADTMLKIGVVEASLAVLFLVPRVDVWAALLLTAYLGGATATHVRVGDPFFFPIIIGFVMWLSLALRNKNLRDFLLSP